ncbi:MAG: cytochrome c [Actinobacteria bacterium]|nr:cytochrome c [Actinomycetota bacterium]
MRPIHAIPVVLLAAALAGCGGGGGGGDTNSAGTRDAPPATQTQAQTQTQTQSAPNTKTTAPAKGPDGAKLFAGNCASCHTLAAANAHGAVGPNLDDLKPDAGTVQQQVENGGGGMPSFGGTLSGAEIAAVARYVADNAGR